MRLRRGRAAALAAAVVAAFVSVSVGDISAGRAATAASAASVTIGTVSQPVAGRLTVAPLRELAAERAGTSAASVTDEGLGRGASSTAPATPDPVLQTAPTGVADGPVELTDPLVNFKAQNGGNPPDTVGDVGPDHYVQMVNSTLSVYDKTGPQAAGFPVAINALWAGQGTDQAQCRDQNAGDPIVLYDQQVDKFMVSQFTDPNNPTGPAGTFPMCIAYSQTGDPTGNWFLYQFNLPRPHDYMKYGIWPDGLYMSTYEGRNVGVYVFERAQMINGSLARFLDGGNLSAGTGVSNRGNRILPGDWDGATPPPAGSPAWFVQSKDDAFDGGVDRLELFSFTTDWVNGTATFAAAGTLPTASFSTHLACSPNFRACIEQPGTTNKVDDLANRLMHRLQYRNFGDHEAMVVSQTVDADGNDRAGVRWYELRRPDGDPSWAIHQQGTYAPVDGVERWMSSVAMDREGNMALGYSVSDGTSTFPGIRYTGRRADDLLGAMPQGEHTMVTGQHSLSGSNRWGDYSSMNVDPSDDCTFWYTQMFIGAGGTRSTQVGAFRFPSCADVNLRVTKEAPTTVVAGDQLAYTVTVTNSGRDTATDVVVEDTLPAGLQLVSTAPACAAGPPISCDLGDMLPAQTRAVSIVARVPAGLLSSSGVASKTIVNTATARSDQVDTVPGDNTDEAATTVSERADIAVSKVCREDASISAVILGTCDVFVDNAGPSDAQNVELIDSLSSTSPFVVTSVTVTPAGSGTCTTTPNAAVPTTSKTVTCDLDTEPAFGRTTITVSVAAARGADVSDTATVSSSTPDPRTSNNRASGALTLSPRADLVIGKDATPSPVNAGESITYDIEVTNDGPSPATNVVVEDQLPAQVTFTSAVASQGQCGPFNSGTPLQCSLGTLASGGTATVTVVAGVPDDTPDGTIVANQTTVRSDVADPDNSDNLSSVAVPVRAVADLAVLKTSDQDTYNPSATITYTITVTNRGPSDSQAVKVFDDLPTTKQAIYRFDTAGCARPAELLLECSLGTIPSGESKSFEVHLIVKGNRGQVVNVARLESPTATFDPQTANNSSTRSVLIQGASTRK